MASFAAFLWFISGKPYVCYTWNQARKLPRNIRRSNRQYVIELTKYYQRLCQQADTGGWE
jgi:hypothetical protein